MTNESNYSAPNGVQFKITVDQSDGKWKCRECGQERTTNECGDDPETQAKLLAKEHSVMCGAWIKAT